MFANLKKKLEEVNAVSPVGAGNSGCAQNTSYVHGGGVHFCLFCLHLLL